MSLFGTSGIRRLADTDLVQLALKVGLAVGSLYKNVVIGRDTRTSGSAIRHAVVSGLLASGARCSDAGIVPTPTVAFIAREFSAGIMITASHNPPRYNGIKLLNPDGSAFSPRQQEEIEQLVADISASPARWDNMTAGEVYSTAVEKHIAAISSHFPGGIKLNVVVDAGCCAAYFITPHLLTSLGCQVTALNCYPDGIFPHDVEPLEKNLGDLIATVKSSGADLGIAHDGDADRMMAVDDKGRFISGDRLLAIFARASGGHKIVTTLDASMAIDEGGYTVRRTKIGDPYVSEVLKKWGDFGGEPSGAWVFPQISLCPDGVFAAAQIADIARQQKLSELVDSIPAYPVLRGNLNGSISSLPKLKAALEKELKPVSLDNTDGLKLLFADGWLLIRASGTEPKVRLTAEAHTDKTARSYFDTASAVLSAHLKD
jgi:phosphoglucosamine mutase